MHRIFLSDISDHLLTFLITKLDKSTKEDKKLETRIYDEQTIATFKTICWNNIYTCKDPEKGYAIFYNKILFTYNNAFPLVQKKYKERET